MWIANETISNKINTNTNEAMGMKIDVIMDTNIYCFKCENEESCKLKTTFLDTSIKADQNVDKQVNINVNKL